MSRMAPLPRLPFALLGLLTLACFGGPFALMVVRGGPSGDWPPDRPVEWIVIATMLTAVLALFIACVTVGLWYPWPHRSDRAGRPSAPGTDRGPGDPAS